MRLLCFCGHVSEDVCGALYCHNPRCPEYLNIMEGTNLEECPDEEPTLRYDDCPACVEEIP